LPKPNNVASNIKQLIVFLVFIALAMFISRQINTFLGQKAMESTGLVRVSYEEALSLSRESGKPILLKFAAIWCSSCRTLDRNVLSDESVRERLSQDFHYVRLDYDNESDQKLFQSYGVSGFPVLKIVDFNGAVIKHLNTPRTAQQMLANLP
jgi:thiol:disulfide interchange protein